MHLSFEQYWKEQIEFYQVKIGIHPDEFWVLAPVECDRIARAKIYETDILRSMHRTTQWYVVRGYAKNPPATPEKLYHLSIDQSIQEKVESTQRKLENKKKYNHEELLALWDKKE